MNLDYLARHKKALVLGTTGLDEQQIKKVEDISRVVPVVFSPNMSVGVNVLFTTLPGYRQKADSREYQASPAAQSWDRP
jgi:4-hydroxy-tetrahydrodipicolinate reductase